MDNKIRLAPKSLFGKILEYMPIPTLDLIIKYGNDGVIIVKRKYKPYKGVWALPGLRIYKGEDIDDTIKRIAKDELGLMVVTKNKIIIGQFVGKFKTENGRQDVSTCYCIKAPKNQHIKLNGNHFYSYKITSKVPKNIGAMYRYYLAEYYRKF